MKVGTLARKRAVSMYANAYYPEIGLIVEIIGETNNIGAPQYIRFARNRAIIYRMSAYEVIN